ncbi:MAG TPA: hypothetical protein VF053_10525, partial [Streptosporangiales bacterium]
MSATTKPVRAPEFARPRRSRSTGHIARRVGCYVLVAAFVVVSLFPFYWILATSLKTPDEISAGTTGLWPSRLSIASYVTDLHSNFLQSLANSAIIAISTTALTVVLASLAGYALARLGVRGRGGI